MNFDLFKFLINKLNLKQICLHLNYENLIKSMT